MLTIMGIVARRDGIDLAGTVVGITKGMAPSPRKINRVEVTLKMKTGKPLSGDEKKKLENAAYTCPVALSLHPDIEQAVTFEWEV